MKLDHVGLEVDDIFVMELFYRKVLGFTNDYHYVSRNSPGLRTVFLSRNGVSLELLERPRSQRVQDLHSISTNHISFLVDDVDAEYDRIVKLNAHSTPIHPPRNTGDGYREMSIIDPEGNIIEFGRRIANAPAYPVSAVIFDLDGTLIDSEENYFLADEILLSNYGVTFTREDKIKYIGCANHEMMADLKQRYKLAPSVNELIDRKNELYLEIAETNTHVYPEMKRFLDLVLQKKIPVAIASGSSPIILERLLAVTGLKDYFGVILSAEEVAHGKPAPDVFLEAAQRLGVEPQECIVLEDSQYGVEAAKRGFMRCVAIPYLFEKPLADSFMMADLLFENGMDSFDADRTISWIDSLNQK
jgi:beta-phosphoglucomutase family hydrolase